MPSWCQPQRGQDGGTRGLGEGGELSCPGPSRAAAVGGALLGRPGGRGAPHGLSSLLPLGGSRERSIPQHPTSLHCLLSWTDGRPSPHPRLQTGPWAHPRPGGFSLLCWVHGTEWLVSSEGQVRKWKGRRGPCGADRAGEAAACVAEPCRAGLPRPTPWVGKQTRGSVCRPPSLVWRAEEGEGVSPAHQSWGP